MLAPVQGEHREAFTLAQPCRCRLKAGFSKVHCTGGTARSQGHVSGAYLGKQTSSVPPGNTALWMSYLGLLEMKQGNSSTCINVLSEAPSGPR